MAEENEPAAQDGEIGAKTAGVYEFADTKTSGTVTVVKKWDDQSNNEERPRVDVSISTQKPSKNPLGYTVTFHADAEKGLTFADGSTENEVVYNGNGQAVRGVYKRLVGGNGVVRWYTDRTYKEQIVLDENGQITGTLAGDVDAWPKEVTFEIKGYLNVYPYENEFNQAIPGTVTSVVFTDEVVPADVTLIDVDADGDGGVVAWTESNGAIMKVSTQIQGVKVQAAKHSTSMFEKKSKIQTIDFTNLDTTNVTYMDSMFSGCYGLTRLDVSRLDTSNVTRMDSMFSGCSGLTRLDVSAWDTSNVTRMGSMFSGCSGLTSLNLSMWKTSRVTDMTAMFYGCENLTDLNLTNFDTTNVRRFSSCSSHGYRPSSGMFGNCKKLKNINITVFTISEKVESLDGMFINCCQLKAIDTSNWKVKNATCMRYMFSGCSGLTGLDVSSFDIAKVTDMSNMFYGCSGLTSLDVSSFDTTNVTTMRYMFYGCHDLKSLDLSAFDTSNVTYVDSMFCNCSSLTSLNLSAFDTSNVTNMNGMFQNCRSLTSLDVSKFNTTNVKDMGNMFWGCGKLTSLDLSSFDTAKVANMNCMFLGCNALTTFTTGTKFRFGTDYYLSGTWQNTAGETFTRGNLPSNVADTYTKIAS